MPDTQAPVSPTPEQLELLKARAPHLHAVNSHEGLETAARKIAENEVLAYAKGDASAMAAAESQDNPMSGELFLHSLTAAIEHSEAVVALERQRIEWLTQARTVAADALARVAILAP